MCTPYNFSWAYQTRTYKLKGEGNGANKHVVTILRMDGVDFRLDSRNIELFER